MRKKSSFQNSIRLILLGSILTSFDSHAESGDVESKFNSFYQLGRVDRTLTDQARAKHVHAYYNQNLSEYHNKDSLQSINNNDLKLLFRSAYIENFYNLDAESLEDMRVDINELEKRSLTSEKNYFDFYTRLIANRKFDEASELSKNHRSADIEVLPAFQDLVGSKSTNPTELVLTSNGKEQILVRKSVNLSKPDAQIIIVSQPLCHFSQNAVFDIYSDSKLQAIFKKHAKWLAPQNGILGISDLTQWNQDHRNDAEMTIAYKQAEWPMLDTWATPTFYFFKDGKLITKVVGWSKKDRSLDELKKAMLIVGL